MQTRFSKFLNSLFKYSTIFLLCFVWLNFYIHEFWVAGISAFFISILLGVLLEYFSRKKQNTLTLKANEKKLIEESSLQFMFSEKDCSLKVDLENGGYRIRLEFPLKYGKWLGFTWKANNAGKKIQTLDWGTPGRNDFFKNRLAFGCVSSD